jgi:hypothetical protein
VYVPFFLKYSRNTAQKTLDKKIKIVCLSLMKKIILGGIILFLFPAVYFTYPNDTPDDMIDEINNFWEFISEKEMDIFRLNDRESSLYNEIYNRIQLINKNIYAMLSNEIINNKKDLIITCNGNSNYFELCDRIVNLAPRFNHLNAISLFPPIDRIEPFIFGNIVLRAEDVNVHFENNNSNIDLLFILNNDHTKILQKDTTGQLYDIYMQMLFIMTQQILGERVVGEKIESAGIAMVNIIIPSIPLIELKEHIK